MSESGPGLVAVAEERPVTLDAEVYHRLESGTAKLVCLYLDVVQSASVEECHRALGIDRLTLYPVLQSLVDLGVVERRNGAYARPSA